ncbi:MAG: PSD1 and planctomycete cytochrome C domain-containing protein, partial [Gemmataceae bacterium]|nr:PSD1 and planctomycete cytochrome C domain-containing protein [Gemmataceae bacterium]
VNMKRMLLLAFVLAVCTRSGRAEEPPPSREHLQFFEAKVRPLLVNRCHQCHGAQKQSKGLRLDSGAAIRAGGDSGPALVPGKPHESLLIRAIHHEGPKMPPKVKLPPEEIAILTQWVTLGAPWPAETRLAGRRKEITPEDRQHWAFRPLTRAPVPAVQDRSWPKNPVDHFILARLEAHGLTPLPPADRRTLLRRVTYDLTGLPPTPEEIEAFLADDAPDAFARVVDRLLATPAYGERWGRHWLDLVRYADTAGDNSDYPVPQLYKYRNWVIRAFNQDRPYDQFLREQLAGDLLPSRSEAEKYDQIIATGYLANTRRFGSYEDARYQWYLTYEDTIDNLGRTILGLTINCARCHDHKFDPLVTEDYYALYGFFQSTRYPWPGIELDKVPKDLVPLVPAEQAEAALQAHARKLAPFDAKVKQLEADKAAADKALKEARAAETEDERDPRVADAQKRVDELTKALQVARRERERADKTPLPFEAAYAVAEGKKKIGNAHVHLRGDPEKRGPEVPRRFPLILGGQTLPLSVPGSGRLELAGWLTDPDNPLTARVMVNRIWHYHLGKGIVQTPSDFGKQGKPPTHPELLDWLARHFIDGGWSVKALHRLILLSQTYQLSSGDHAANAQVDSNNDFLWQFGRRRLDAEAIRDTLLALSGTLERSPGGPHPFPDQTTWGFTQHNPFKAVYETNRRSVYLMTQRIQRHPYLALFDGPDTNASTARRVMSTTPLQALYLMNEPFVHAQARRFAARLLAERPTDAERIAWAYLLTFGRPATLEEQSHSADYLAGVWEKLQTAGVPVGQQALTAWESYARALFLTNEFVYVH